MTATHDSQAIEVAGPLPNTGDWMEVATWMVTTSLRLPGLPYNLETAKPILQSPGHDHVHRRTHFELVHEAGAGFADCSITVVDGQWSRGLVKLRQGIQAWAVHFDLSATPGVFTRVFCPGDLVQLRPDHGDEELDRRLGDHRYLVTSARELAAWCAWPDTHCSEGHNPNCHVVKALENGHPQVVTLARAVSGELVGSPADGLEAFSGAYFIFAPKEDELPPLWRFADASEATPTGASTRLGSEG